VDILWRNKQAYIDECFTIYIKNNAPFYAFLILILILIEEKIFKKQMMQIL
jgi:hypothetical protein